VKPIRPASYGLEKWSPDSIAFASGRVANILPVSTMRCSHSNVVTVRPFQSIDWSISSSRIRSAGIPWVSRRTRQTSGEAASAIGESFMSPGTSWM
jgi:hypothetical protein